MIEGISLKNRFRIYLLLFVAVLLPAIVFIMPKLYEQGLHDSSGGALIAAAAYYEEQLITTPQALPISTPELHIFTSFSDIPNQLLEYFAIRQSSYQQIYSTGGIEGDNYVVVYFYKKKLINNKTLYLFHRIDTAYRPGHSFTTINQFQWLFAIIGLIWVLVISQLLIRKVVHPIIELSNWLKTQKSNSPLELPSCIKNDEIGYVAHVLSDTLTKMSEVNQREKQFLSCASHELRTPISVIVNSIELIDRAKSRGHDNFEKAFDRIKNAGQGIKALTDSLLWLNSIESREKISPTTFNLHKELLLLINQNCLNQSDESNFKLVGESNIEVCLEKAIFLICMNNLIRNALQHAYKYPIIVEYSRSQLIIRNYSEGCINMDHEEILQYGVVSERGFGLGLSMVARFAKICNWQFSLDIKDGKAVSRLNFSKNNM